MMKRNEKCDICDEFKILEANAFITHDIVRDEKLTECLSYIWDIVINYLHVTIDKVANRKFGG